MSTRRTAVRGASTGVLGLFVVLMVGTAIAGTVHETFDKTYRFEPGGDVSLSNTNGSVTVRTWKRDEVRVEAQIEVKARRRRDAERFLKEVRILVDDRPDQITIETDYPRRHGGGGVLDWVFGGKTPSVTVTYRLTVPKRADLDLRTVNGGVEVDDVTGEVEVGTTNGKVELYEVRGTIDAHTTNGGIHAEVEGFSEDDEVYLKTVNGGITLYLPDDARADVSGSAVNGGIHTRFPLKVRGKWGPKKISGRLNGGGGRVELRTVNGGIRIRRT
jgi:DUF4097 and DUF4098 domain-containing protein YvlB